MFGFFKDKLWQALAGVPEAGKKGWKAKLCAKELLEGVKARGTVNRTHEHRTIQVKLISLSQGWVIIPQTKEGTFPSMKGYGTGGDGLSTRQLP